MQLKQIIFLSFLIITMVQITSNPQGLERKDVQEKYKWNLNDLYPDLNAWSSAKKDDSLKIEDIVKYKSTIGNSAENLYAALNNYFSALKEFYRVADYAERLSDEDLRISKNQSLTQEISNLGTEFSEKTAFLSPEILKVS